MIMAVQEGDKQGLSPESLLRFVPTWVSLQERSPNKAVHSPSAEAAADLRMAHPAAFTSTSAPSQRISKTHATDDYARWHHKLLPWVRDCPLSPDVRPKISAAAPSLSHWKLHLLNSD